MQGMHRGGGFGKRSVGTEVDDGRYEGDGSRTKFGRYMSRNRKQSYNDRSEPG